MGLNGFRLMLELCKIVTPLILDVSGSIAQNDIDVTNDKWGSVIF